VLELQDSLTSCALECEGLASEHLGIHLHSAWLTASTV
jgi:hypothetical protein